MQIEDAQAIVKDLQQEIILLELVDSYIEVRSLQQPANKSRGASAAMLVLLSSRK